jgi:hypothetical protein
VSTSTFTPRKKRKKLQKQTESRQAKKKNVASLDEAQQHKIRGFINITNFDGTETEKNNYCIYFRLMCGSMLQNSPKIKKILPPIINQ